MMSREVIWRRPLPDLDACLSCDGTGDCPDCDGDGVSSCQCCGAEKTCAVCDATGCCNMCNGTGKEDCE